MIRFTSTIIRLQQHYFPMFHIGEGESDLTTTLGFNSTLNDDLTTTTPQSNTKENTSFRNQDPDGTYH